MALPIERAEALVQQPRSRRGALFLLALIILLLLTYWSWAPLASSGYPLGHDGLHPIRVYTIDRCLRDGQLPCRWSAELAYNYGFPIFNYYPPGASYVSEAIHLMGFSIQDAIKIVFILGFILSALFMFLLAREFWGNLGGMTAALFYVYAPYHALDAYVRSAQAEYWALTFFPGVLWSAYMVVKEGKLPYVLALAFFVAMLLLSHNLMTAIFVPLAVAWGLLWALRSRRLERGVLLALCTGWGLALAAFFTLPALFEIELTHADILKTGYHNNSWYYRDHFVEWRQLFFTRFWGFGGSVLGPADGMSFQIGYLHWGIALASLVVASIVWRKNRTASLAIILVFVFFWLSVFMTHEKSDFIWQAVSSLEWLQFPWRFLALTIFTSSFLAGALFLVVRDKTVLSLMLFVALVGGVIGANQEFFRAPDQKLYISDEERFSGYFFDILLTSGPSVIDYLPATASEPTAFPPAEVEVVGGGAALVNIEQKSSTMSLVAETSTGATLRASIFDFPNWKVRIDGKTVPHNHDNELGLITFEVPPGKHNVYLKLEDTAIRTFSNSLSLVAWVLFVAAAAALLAVAARRLLHRVRAGTAAPDVSGKDA